MMARRPPAPPLPSAMAVGLLRDGKRTLFLVERDAKGAERIALPHILLYGAQDPVAALAQAVREQTGIDAQVHEVVRTAPWNAGSRKRRKVIPVLQFALSAKSAAAKPAAPYIAYRWLADEEVAKLALSRRMEWIR